MNDRPRIPMRDVPSTPDSPTTAQLQAEIALLRLQVRSALMSSQAAADTIVQLAEVVHTQGAYIERLDDLWYDHIQASLTEAADEVYQAYLASNDASSEPDPGDVLQVDLWHDESITTRIN